jgi:hypothetical protein
MADAECSERHEQPTGHRLSDYKQLKRELGLERYEGRSWLGCYRDMLDRPPLLTPNRSRSPPTASDGGFPGVEMSFA